MKTVVKFCLFMSVLALTTQLHAGDKKAHGKAKCPEFLNQEFKRLHSEKTVNLCSLYNGKPIVFVNTASHCGKTKQFGPLETLNKKYKEKGLQIVGFTSNDFNQAAKNEEAAASICYKNYGVTFTMLAPTKVKGKDANPVFSHLAKESGQEPGWNFNKYLVSGDGKKVKHYDTNHQPLGDKLEADIEKELKS